MPPSPWLDCTLPIHNGMVVWPGDTPVALSRTAAIASGDPCNVSQLLLSVHTGTHLDAPVHFLEGGPTLDAWTPDATVGPARLVPIADPARIDADELRRFSLQPGERILLQTENSRLRLGRPLFQEDYIALTPSAAAYLAESQIRTLAVDYLSVDPFQAPSAPPTITLPPNAPPHTPYPAHHLLFAAGIWIIEGAALAQVPPGPCEMLGLPLRLQGCDGAPLRLLVRPL